MHDFQGYFFQDLAGPR